jgi:gliding motility-associated lipoprotein GldB
MKNIVWLLLALIFISCGNDNKVTQEIETIPVSFEMERFDKLFYESKPEELNNVKAKYPYFFPEGNEDTVWTNKLKNPLLRELYNEVQEKYANLNPLKEDLTAFFKHVQFYFPKYKTPRVITLISEVNLDTKAIYADSLALLSLDCYLGENHKFYTDFPAFKRISLNEDQILPDLVSSFANGKIAPPQDKNLLSIMIYFGKELYLKDKLIPDYSDAAKIAYTEQQIAWCKENEEQMWRYFIENNLLYEANVKNEYRFINDAPFSKFYLEIDNESPGRVGQWLGWQIVRSYMENNDTSLNDMLAMDAKTLFEKSKYKPKK